MQLDRNSSPESSRYLFITNPTWKFCFPTLYLCLTAVVALTSQPGHTVGFGRRSVNSEGFSSKRFFVFRFLYQVSDFSHEPVKESWQHRGATNNHQVLCQLLPGVYGTLMQTGIKKVTRSKLTAVAWTSVQRSVRNSVSLHTSTAVFSLLNQSWSTFSRLPKKTRLKKLPSQGLREPSVSPRKALQARQAHKGQRYPWH